MNIKEIAQEWITANDHLPLMTCGCGHCPGCIADERYYLIRDLLYSANDHEEEVKKLKEEIELLKVQDAAIDEWHEEIETRTKESVQRAVAAEREAITNKAKALTFYLPSTYAEDGVMYAGQLIDFIRQRGAQ